MDSDRVEAVSDWESEPFSEGYAGLHRLADRGFSGAVTDGRAWLFALNGTVIGVFDGTLEDFEDADGTAYVAPDPSLPLLYTMQELEGETRARYYTEDTDLSEVHETLTSGRFTGFVELSENVLSGDYYIVYHGGKSMSVAFVGNSGRLVTGDDAFERAVDEVGLYEVRSVPVEPVELPEPEDDEDDAEAETPVQSGVTFGGEGDESPAESDADAADDAGESGTLADAVRNPSADASDDAGPAETTREQASETSTDEPRASAETPAETPGADASVDETSPDAPGADDESVAAESAVEDETDAGDEAADDETPAPREDADARDGPEPRDAAGTNGDQGRNEGANGDGDTSARESNSPNSTDSPERPVESAEAGTTRQAPEPRASEAESDRAQADARESAAGTSTPSAPDAGTEASVETRPPTSDVDAERQWQETRTIPSLDPERTIDDEVDEPAASTAERNAVAGDGTSPRTPRESNSSEPRQAARPADSEDGNDDVRERIESLEAERDEYESRVEELESTVADLEAERDELEAECERLRSERDEYESRVEELESTVADLESQIDTLEERLAEARQPDRPESRTLSPEEAVSGTNLFVRYESKGGPTLSKAIEGDAQREEVNDNLRLEYHTSFETEGLAVEDEPFPRFLENTAEYRFTRWVVRDLPYEIRETGKRARLEALYGAVAKVDRVEFDGSVTLRSEREDEETSEYRFDVVLRNRMGDPVMVANLNDSRDPTTGPMMETLIRDASDVADAEDTLTSAFYVTASYYEPDALETASEATGSGLLRREKRASFVKLSRKDGYHLCLVETRNGEFHVTVPEL